MPAFPAFTKRGQAIPGPSSLPSQAGQFPTWNADGTFAGWQTPGTVAPVNLVSGAASQVPLSVQAHASQTANLFEARNSVGTALTVIDKYGGIQANSSSDQTGPPGFGLNVNGPTGNSAIRINWTWNTTTPILQWSSQGGWTFSGGNQRNSQFANQLRVSASGNRGDFLDDGVIAFYANGVLGLRMLCHGGYSNHGQLVVGSGVSVVSANPRPQLNVRAVDTTRPSAAFIRNGASTHNLSQWMDDAENVLASVRYNGAFAPASLADASAQVSTLYYSTDAAKLVYKDAAGVVNALY